MTLRSPKRALWIFLLCAAFCAFSANAMDANPPAVPGHAWTPAGHHIIAMGPESGHPAIMDGTTTCDPQRTTRRLLSPLALKRTLGVRLPSNLVIFNNKMGAATLLPLRMVG